MHRFVFFFQVGGGMLDMEKIEKPKVAPKFKLNIKKNGKIIFKKDMALISPVSELAYKQFMDGYVLDVDQSLS